MLGASMRGGLGSVSFASGRRPVPANSAGSALMADRLKVMVTGATGKIGQTLMEDLPDDFEVTGTSRSPNDDPRFIQLDFDDVDTIAQAFAGQDVVVHMHAKSNHNTDEFEPYLQPNIVGLWNAYEAARLAGARHDERGGRGRGRAGVGAAGRLT